MGGEVVGVVAQPAEVHDAFDAGGVGCGTRGARRPCLTDLEVDVVERVHEVHHVGDAGERRVERVRVLEVAVHDLDLASVGGVAGERVVEQRIERAGRSRHAAHPHAGRRELGDESAADVPGGAEDEHVPGARLVLAATVAVVRAADELVAGLGRRI